MQRKLFVLRCRSFASVFIMIVLAALAVGACAQAGAPTGAATTEQASTSAPAAVETQAPGGTPATLRIAVLPILEALPMYVADQKGYFADNGVKVEFIPVQSAAERDQVMAAGQADGMINDLVSTLFYNKDDTQIQIVRFARTATPEFPQYRILAAPNSGIKAPADLKGVPIGISEGSVIAYTTDRLLQAEGLEPGDIQTVAVPKIADRMSLLASGELKAANMPDPFSLLAMQAGASVVLDDSKHPEYGNSVYSFRKSVIDEQPEAVRGFLAAVNQAIQDVNADKDQWSSLLSEKQLVPAPLVGSYQIPTLPEASTPTQAQWDDVLAWAKDKGLVSADVAYGDSVNSSFLGQ
jgi:NitT/TauT family transport system substrate-binding protein